MVQKELNFDELLPITSRELAELKAGDSLALVLLEYVSTGGRVLFRVQYIHRELTYRTPGQKDAVAFGTARLEDGGKEYREVRILFSQPNQTATMRGLTLEGKVKRVSAATFVKEAIDGRHR